MVVSSSANPAVANSTVTFSAAASGSGGTPTGSVGFFDGSNNLGSAALNSAGLAALSTAALTASGSPHAITAVYSGDSVFAGSVSSVLSQIITNPAAPPVSAGPDITNGLVAWYPLAGDANDHSGNGNNGTAVNSPSYANGVTGAANTALSFNGANQLVTIPASASLDITNGSITLSAWVYATNSGQYRQIINKRQGSSAPAAYGLCLFNANNGLDFYFTSGNNFQVFHETSPSMSLNSWNFVAATFTWGNASSVTLYVNGVAKPGAWSVGSGTASSADATSSVAVNLGGLTGNAEPFGGNLAGVRIYDRALSGTEIGTLYSNGPN